MHKLTLVFLALLSLASCNKSGQLPITSTFKPTTDDVRTVLLKDVEFENLPAPYIHFEYDSQHYAKKISFASDLFVYSIEYDDKAVKKLVNQRDKSYLMYTYNSNSQVSNISEFSAGGAALFRYEFSYDSLGQLTQSFWYQYSNGG